VSPNELIARIDELEQALFSIEIWSRLEEKPPSILRSALALINNRARGVLGEDGIAPENPDVFEEAV
jgi:hypothetical protein